MFMIKKFLTVLFVLTLANCSLIGQQTQYNWKLSTSGGIYSYYGDLTDNFRLIQPTSRTIKPFDNINFESFGWSVERSLSDAWTIGLNYNKGVFTINDRAIDWNGELRLNNKYFSRSLNAQTKIKNYNLFFAYYLDNGNLLRKKATLSPYFKLGAGLTSFQVFGDLFTNGQRYFYWPDGTIRDAAPGTSNANIITQDGIFETNLTQLQTEGKKYKTTVFTPSLCLGLKFRVSQKLNLNFEYGFFFTQTDYLDDVAGKYLEDYSSDLQRYAANPSDLNDVYRGKPDGKKDLFTFSSFSMQYSFAKKPSAFQAPAIFTGSLLLPNSDSISRTPSAKEEMEELSNNKHIYVIVEIDSTIEISNTDTTIIVTKVVRQKDDNIGRTDSMTVEVEVEADNELQKDSISTSDEIEVIVDAEDTTTNKEISVRKEQLIAPDSTVYTEKEIEEELIRLDSMAAIQRSDSTVQKVDSTINTGIDSTGKVDSDTTVVDEPDMQKEPRMDIDTVKISRELPDSISIDTVRIDSTKSPFPKKKIQIQNIDIEGNATARDTMRVNEEVPVNPEPEGRKQEIPSELLNEIQELKMELQATRNSVAKLEEVKELVLQDRETLQRIEKQLSELEAASESSQNNRLAEQLDQLKAETKRLKEEVRLLASKNNVVIVERGTNTEPPSTANDSISTLSAKVRATQAYLDSLRSDSTQVIQSAVTDSLSRLVQKLQADLDEMRRIQKEKEISEQEQKEQEQKRLDELKKQQEIKRIQEEAAARQKHLEEEKERLEAALIEKEKKEKELAEKEKLEKIVKEFGLKSIYFDKNSTEITSQHMEVVTSAVKLLLAHPKLKIQVKGFADPSGSKELNLKLARQRALSVTEAIKNLGISEKRIELIGGEIDYNATLPSKGRRVDIALVQ